MQTLNESKPSRISGVVLIVSTLLSVMAMAHHPTVTTPDIAQALQQLRSMADLSSWVHGTLIALMLVNFYVLVEFCLQRGMERPLVRAGLIGYGAGVVAMIGAATVSGWITARIAGFIPNPTDADLRTLSLLIDFSGTLNRTMANVGAVAMSAGILAWAAGLLHSRGWPRVVGVIGVLAGLAPAAGLIFGAFHLDVHGMMAVVLMQAVWTIGIGMLLIQGRARP